MAVTKSLMISPNISTPPLTEDKLSSPSCSFYGTSNNARLTSLSPTQSSSDTSMRGSKRQRCNTTALNPQTTNPLDELLIKEIAKPQTEEDIFCQFLVSRLKKLDRKRYLKLTHTIMMEVMKLEEEEL